MNTISEFNELIPEVILITDKGGVMYRRIYRSSWYLFRELQGIAKTEPFIQISQGDRLMERDSVNALNQLLIEDGWKDFKTHLKTFDRMRFGTKYAWNILTPYLGLKWRKHPWSKAI